MKKILILGATSAIAAACAKQWQTQNPSEFFLLARSAEKLQQTAADLSARGAKVHSQTLDFTDTPALQTSIDAAFAQLGEVDVVLVAHGTLPNQAECEAHLAPALQALNDNTMSTLAALTVICNKMAAQKRGNIAVISSVAGDRGRPSNYVYGAAKAAVTTFCQGAQARLFKVGVHLTIIKPGFVDTPMTQGLALPAALLATPEKVAQEIVQAVEKNKSTLYTPWFWWPIMRIIQHVPVFVFKRLSL